MGDAPVLSSGVMPSGYPDLDQALPGGGWPKAGLVDVACDVSGIGELSLLLSGNGGTPRGPMLWIMPASLPFIPYAPGLLQRGFSPSQSAVVRTRDAEETLWVAEQALRSGGAEAVLLWLNGAYCNPLHLRRLQQAAMTGGVVAFAMRPAETLHTPSPAILRIALQAGTGGRLRVDLVKRRGLPAGQSLYLTTRALPCLKRDAPAATKRLTPRWLSRLLLSTTPAPSQTIVRD
jgi:hypothetical protein